MNDDGFEGSGVAWIEEVFSDHAVLPFWKGNLERNPDPETSSDQNVVPFVLPSGELFWPPGVVLYLWILASCMALWMDSLGHLFDLWSEDCSYLQQAPFHDHLHEVLI